MKFDLHTHHERCGHAPGSIENYILAAIRNDLEVIGISDHSPYFSSPDDHPKPHIAMAKSAFPAYVREVLKLKSRYKDRIKVLLGVESDFFPEHIEAYRKHYEAYPFDYVIGSVHRTQGVSIFNRRRWEGLDEGQKKALKDEYLGLIAQSARSGLFHIVGHIDAMKANYPAYTDIQTEALEQTLNIIAEHGLVVEVNTSGKLKSCGGWYPSDELLERMLHMGIAVTFGSDAHTPDRVGDEWEKVRDKLKTIGYRHWVYVENRKPVPVPL